MKSTLLALSVSALALAGCSATVSPSAPAQGCAPDSSVEGCSGDATGYSCDTDDNPESTDSSLVCSDGTPASGGFTLYCCVQFTSSSCSPDSSVAGCQGDSIGFSCNGNDTPDEADSSLVCSTGTPSGGQLLYCCAP